MDVDVVDLVNAAFERALILDECGDTPGKIHQLRSRNFVDELGRYFTEHCQPNERVLTRGSSKHRDDFGLNELLFDVLVCEHASTRAAKADKDLLFVSKGLWAVESEFARDSRKAIRDFQKLVLADCENRLFIGPQVEAPEAFRRPLGDVAARCRGTIYAAFVPHPDCWDALRASGAPRIAVYCWTTGDWQPVAPRT